VKEHHRNSSFGKQSGYFICSKFVAKKSCHITHRRYIFTAPAACNTRAVEFSSYPKCAMISIEPHPCVLLKFTGARGPAQHVAVRVGRPLAPWEHHLVADEFPVAAPKTVATTLLKLARSSGRRKTKYFCPLSRSLSTPLYAGVWRWGPIAWTKKGRKNKTTPQAPPHTAYSVRGPGGVAQLGPPPQDKNIFLSPFLSRCLSPPLWAWAWHWGPIARTKKDRKKTTPQAPPHTARTLGA
jgi:hypothetical protein